MPRPDERRREFLIRVLASGAFAVSLPLAGARTARSGAAGPAPLPAGRSIYRLQGSVRINGRAAIEETVISASDLIETGADGLLIFVVGKDAFILRNNSVLQLSTGSAGTGPEVAGATVSLMRVLTGKVLSVFGAQRHEIQTPVAAIGIRGTGIYVESEPAETYVCTCYGIADLAAIADPASAETVTSTHHSAPRYVSADGAAGTRIQPAPFKNHDDEELLLIESLVGRTTPFVVPGRSRRRNRRYY